MSAPTSYTISFPVGKRHYGSHRWDLRGAKGWIDAIWAGGSSGFPEWQDVDRAGVSSTPVNHDLEIFRFSAGGHLRERMERHLPASATRSRWHRRMLRLIRSASGVAPKTFQWRTPVLTQSGSTVNTSAWAALHFSFIPASTSTLVTIGDEQRNSRLTAMGIGAHRSRGGTATGDVELICISFGTNRRVHAVL